MLELNFESDSTPSWGGRGMPHFCDLCSLVETARFVQHMVQKWSVFA